MNRTGPRPRRGTASTRAGRSSPGTPLSPSDTPSSPPGTRVAPRGWLLFLPRRPQLPVCLWLPQLHHLRHHPLPHLRREGEEHQIFWEGSSTRTSPLGLVLAQPHAVMPSVPCSGQQMPKDTGAFRASPNRHDPPKGKQGLAASSLAHSAFIAQATGWQNQDLPRALK